MQENALRQQYRHDYRRGSEQKAIRLLAAIREFVALWEQHVSLIPRLEEEELAARRAARDALTHVEDCARWLQAEIEVS